MEDLIYGFELNNEAWLVGYGLDATNGTKRNQPFITGQLIEE
jgi:hypoxanthine-guanine phosphoribosyltransferase